MQRENAIRWPAARAGPDFNGSHNLRAVKVYTDCSHSTTESGPDVVSPPVAAITVRQHRAVRSLSRTHRLFRHSHDLCSQGPCRVHGYWRGFYGRRIHRCHDLIIRHHRLGHGRLARRGRYGGEQLPGWYRRADPVPGHRRHVLSQVEPRICRGVRGKHDDVSPAYAVALYPAYCVLGAGHQRRGHPSGVCGDLRGIPVHPDGGSWTR